MRIWVVAHLQARPPVATRLGGDGPDSLGVPQQSFVPGIPGLREMARASWHIGQVTSVGSPWNSAARSK